jgi:O-antigen ligase
MRLSKDRKAAVLMVGALTVGAGWAAITAIREYGTFVQMGDPAQRAQSPFFSPNFLAGFLALTLPVVTAWCLTAKERLGALGLGVVSALMLGALVATGSRAGLALTLGGLVVALLLALLTGRGKGLPWARVGALIAAFGVLAFACRGPIIGRVGSATEAGSGSGTPSAAVSGGGQEHSGAYRAWTWKGSLAMAQANPLLGAGPGTFPFLYPRHALVARTDLAHSSYLQIAAEQGFPALITSMLAILAAVVLGAMNLFRRPDPATNAEIDYTLRLLLCGVLGGLLAAAARSVFDSEWSLLGNGIPFWAVVGLAAGIAPSAVYAPATIANMPAPAKPKLFAAGGLLVGLVFALLVLRGASARDSITAALEAGRPPQVSEEGWPPDPQLLYFARKPEEAAKVEPTGKRFYQLARYYEQQGETEKAIAALKDSVKADPNALQTWRRLAEMQTAAGDTPAALDSWRELVKRHEGPVGQVRAIPELADTYPAYAYAAIADAAAKSGNNSEAVSNYEKAAAIVEEYSRTNTTYQRMEIMSAQVLNTDVTARRAEIRALYEKVIADWITLEPTKRTELTQRRDETLDRLGKLLTPESLFAPEKTSGGNS